MAWDYIEVDINEVETTIVNFLKLNNKEEFSSDQIKKGLKRKPFKKDYHIADVRRALTYLEDTRKVEFTCNAKFRIKVR